MIQYSVNSSTFFPLEEALFCKNCYIVNQPKYDFINYFCFNCLLPVNSGFNCKRCYQCFKCKSSCKMVNDMFVCNYCFNTENNLLFNLKSKIIKRCERCNTILIKQDEKINSIDYKIKSLAR
jgi:hypothetical protein